MLISEFTDALLKSQVLFVNISQCTVWTNMNKQFLLTLTQINKEISKCSSLFIHVN